MDRLPKTTPQLLPLLLEELGEAWPFLCKEEKIEGVGLLSRSQAEEFLERLDATEQADVVLGVYSGSV